MSKFNTCLRKGYVRFGDDFDTVSEVTHLFGPKATKLPYKNTFSVPEEENTIVCLLSEEGGRGWHNTPVYGTDVDSRGWKEIVTVHEFNDNYDKTIERINDEIATPRTRYVFWREERLGVRWYKFYGTFKIDVDATRATLDTDKPHVVYERNSETAYCLRTASENTKPYTDAEFEALNGQVIEFKLLDEIVFCTECGEKKIKVWPGMSFSVENVDLLKGIVICTTQDESLLNKVKMSFPEKNRKQCEKILYFTVPLKDFDLGYVGIKMEKDKIGKVIEVKKPIQIEYTSYYYTSFSGCGTVEAEPGIKFRITDVAVNGAYVCRSLDKEFIRKTEKIEIKSVTPILRLKFGHINGFYLPAIALAEGTAEIVDWVEPEMTEEDCEDDWNMDEDESVEVEEEQAYGYPKGYAKGRARGAYCVIDLKAPKGTNPVSYLDDVPEGGWTDEYKTSKIVLKLIKGGEFIMGNDESDAIREDNPPHRVHLPNDFYIGIFPVTKKQFELAVRDVVEMEKLDPVSAVCPMTFISYDDIRGVIGGFNWPEDARVDFDCFLAYLRQRCGIDNIDIPTAAQWEYACKAGSEEPRSVIDKDISSNAWTEENSEGKEHPVGLLEPNKWGLYDMLGNVWEWCLDWYGAYENCNKCESPTGLIPDFVFGSGVNGREMRGGGWNVSASKCDASTRGSSGPSHEYEFVGFRLSITLDA